MKTSEEELRQQPEPSGRDRVETIPSAATHTPRQERRYIIALVAVMALLGCLYPALRTASYRGSADFHATIEMTGALVGLVAGFALVMRFYALGNRFHLLIGLAFFVNGAEDLVQGLLSFEIIHSFTGAPASSLEQFIPGTCAAGRLMLGVLLLAAPLARTWPRTVERPKLETLWVTSAAVILTIVVTTVAFLLPLPQFIYPGRLISRPVDLVSAVVLLLALVVFLREYHRSRDMLLWWVSLSIGINVMGQVLMSFSKELYDPLFDISHISKVLGYVAPLLGLSLYQIAIIADSRRAEEKIAGLAKFPSENPNPVLRIMADGTVLYANDAAAALLGELHSGVGKAAPNCWLKWIKKALDSGLINVVEFKHHARTFSFTVAPVAEGRYVNLYGRDITERKQAEEALERQREEYQTILDSMPAWVWYVNTEFVIVRANKAAAEASGLSQEEIVGRHTQELFPEMWDKYAADDQEVLDSGKPKIGIIETLLLESGEQRWVQTDKVPYRDKEGNIIGVIVFALDITERKRAEEQIESLARFPSENPNPVLRIMADGTVLYANDAAAALLGELHSGAGKAAPNCWLKWIKKALASGLTRTVEFEHDARTLSFMVAPVGEAGYVNLYGTDITERKRAEKDLRESEERYRSVFEAPADAFFIVSPDGLILDANPAAREMHGYSGDEIIGMPVIQLIEPDYRYQFDEFRRSLLSTGSFHTESLNVRKDGTTFEVDVRGAMVRYCGEDCFLAVLRDITERKQAELALVDRMKELNCRYAISRLDRAEIALSTILQKTAEIIPPGWQYPGITCARITFEDQEFKSAKFETTPWSQTSDIYVHDCCVGSVEVYHLEEKPEIDEGPFLKEERDLIDDIARYLSSIIERKQAEQSLKESEERYRQLFEYAHDLIFTVDASTGLITTMNDACRDVLSYEPDDLTNKPYSAFVSSTDLDAVGRHIEAAIGDTSETIEAWCTRKDGTPVLLDLRMRSIPVPGREAVLHVIAYDVTQRHRESEAAKRLGEILQQRVREKTADLEEANRDLLEAQTKLIQAEKFAALGQLAAGVAHEINNPLSFVANNLAVLRRDYRLVLDIHRLYKQMAAEEDPRRRQQLAEQAQAREAEVNFEYIVSNLEHVFDRTADGTERIRRIVHDMRDFTRVGEGEWKETDINNSLDSTVTILFHEMKAKDIHVEKHYQELPPVYCMPGRINQVFLNVITNAVEAVPEGGRIDISTSPVEKGVRVAITDNGVGIPEKDLGRIFDPFFTTKPKSSGLGLSISYGIISDHKGSIEATSTPGQVTEFVITLPLRPEEK